MVLSTIALAVASFLFLKGKKQTEILSVIFVILTPALVVAIVETVNLASRGGFLSGLGVAIGVYLFVVPLLLMISLTLFYMSMIQIGGNLNLKYRFFYTFSTCTYAAILGFFWIGQTFVFLSPPQIIEFLSVGLTVLGILLIYIGVPVVTVIMLILGFRSEKEKSNRIWLVFIFLFPIIGPMIFLFITKLSSRLEIND